jgi:hypothetical protein
VTREQRQVRDGDLVRRLVGGDEEAVDAVLAAAPESESASLLVAAGLVARDASHLRRAAGLATTPRERQLVALAEADLRGETDLLDALVREHLAEHPDHLLAAWIAGRSTARNTDKEIRS